MRLSRVLFPLLLTLLLLFAQQSGAAHALHHALAKQDQQHGKHAPHSEACGSCAAYAQLGGVLGSASHFFTVTAIPSGTVRFVALSLRSSHPLTAIARGPPALLQETT
ncbi:MAG: hypothetical protein DID90_2727554073 [Candidatus Nitrotoga sp. LAW]|nr:MAG: hypothetical protein DID90_2727554073 [Candidatus Nitrotoga sp. LAW]